MCNGNKAGLAHKGVALDFCFFKIKVQCTLLFLFSFSDRSPLFANAEDILETKLETWQEEENPKSEKAHTLSSSLLIIYNVVLFLFLFLNC